MSSKGYGIALISHSQLLTAFTSKRIPQNYENDIPVVEVKFTNEGDELECNYYIPSAEVLKSVFKNPRSFTKYYRERITNCHTLNELQSLHRIDFNAYKTRHDLGKEFVNRAVKEIGALFKEVTNRVLIRE